MTDSACKEIIALETEMHLDSTRKNRARMNELLHDDFKEIGRSGKIYKREEILDELAGETKLPEIHSSNFQIEQLNDSLYLLTYESAHAGAELHRFSRRASLWIKHNNRWQIRFHQGTAISD